MAETPAPLTFQGVIVDAESDQPLPEVLVRVDVEDIARVFPEHEFAHATPTDGDGTFSLSVPNVEGLQYYAFSLMAIHPEYQASRLRQPMSPKQNHYDLGTLPLRSTLRLEGDVLGEEAVEGLEVTLQMHNRAADFFRAAAPVEHTAKIEPTGDFRFDGLYPIEYTLTISRDGYIIAAVDSVNPENQPRLSVQLPELSPLRGRVVGADERPIPEARIRVMLHPETPFGHNVLLASAESDAAGDFEVAVLAADPELLSIEVSKQGYFIKGYRNVDIAQIPPTLMLEKGAQITGRVVLPPHIGSDGQYAVKVFPIDAAMEATLNPLALNRPILSRHFPVTEPNFRIDGLFPEKYALYILGEGISAARLDVTAGVAEEVLVVADQPAVTLQGQVLWADTGAPIDNAIVARSWYPWELNPADMSLTLDRFAVETDAEGRFEFRNLTATDYRLHIRAVHVVAETETEDYQRWLVNKQVAVRATDTSYRIYIGRRDGTPFVEP